MEHARILPPTPACPGSKPTPDIRRRRLVGGAVALLGTLVLLGGLVIPAVASQSTTRGSSSEPRPTTDPADAVMDRLLGRDDAAATEPATTRSTPATGSDPATREGAIDPGAFAGATDRTTGDGDQAVAPDTPTQRLVREGSYVIDRIGRVRPSRDGRGLELIFDSDGQSAASASDPPMVLVPNLNLMAVERVLESDSDRRFRITGRVTEYRGRNHLVIEKVIILR